MTFGARLAVIGLACLQVAVWTCPAYCASAAEPAMAAGAPAVAMAHEDHHSGAVQSESNAISIDAASAGCCGRCRVEQTPQSLTEKYSVSANAAANATVPLPFSLVTVQRSAGPDLPHQPPGASPPVTRVSPLRI